MGGKSILFFVIFLIFSNIGYAATIHGTVYDLELKRVQNAKVEINTNPKQAVVAFNGTYSFNVPNGKYSLRGYLMQRNEIISFVEENITVAQNGDYVLDLILFPNFEEGLEEIDLDVNEDVIKSPNYLFYIALILLLAILAVFAVIAKRLYKKEEKTENNLKIAEGKLEEVFENELDLVVSIIKKEGGRTTQKDIRKQIPLSEAKISLMIAELEHKGVVDKIKKGRGNIIILKKNESHKKNNVIALSLDIGENIVESLKNFCEKNRIKSGFFNGIGAVDFAELAHYNVKTKKYSSKTYRKALEIVSLSGNISSMNNKPYIHCHACFSDDKMSVVAGHLKEAKVSAACEIFIVAADLKLERKYSKEIGLNMLDF